MFDYFYYNYFTVLHLPITLKEKIPYVLQGLRAAHKIIVTQFGPLRNILICRWWRGSVFKDFQRLPCICTEVSDFLLYNMYILHIKKFLWNHSIYYWNLHLNPFKDLSGQTAIETLFYSMYRWYFESIIEFDTLFILKVNSKVVETMEF